MAELRDHLCSTPEATAELAGRLAELLQPGDLIGLIGELGAGKTLLVQALARGLRIPPEVRVTSPTFTLINEYHGGAVSLYHVDLYRIDRARDLDELGLDEICRRADGVVCVEWCDRYPVLGRDFLEIRLDIAGAHARRVSAIGHGRRGGVLATAWADAVSSST
ncbi:tRNA (adenosine(37)-N6)-threonylcarbamoyltransferase complex ATPase subunit type 1 TsaE [Haliangium sp.]|uniref:tRNA (adenosine(37)-N6)-threonylcarbamoyltransferase complex ATPase subunit type 1 TsaE n=1 Tax=Haliangium sp. TaxID=2663208 RepID=UPI003D0C0F27